MVLVVTISPITGRGVEEGMISITDGAVRTILFGKRGVSWKFKKEL